MFWLSTLAFATPPQVGAPLGEGLEPAGDVVGLPGASGSEALAPTVVNGEVVQGDDWEDTVGIAFGNQVGCTGTLIAPDVVLTAGHCVGGITHAVVGTNDTRRGGDWIRARRVIEYPRSQSSYDVALVLLERDATGIEPRPLAVDCVLEDHLRDGAEVAVVGFGATNYAGTQNTNLKHEGYTHIQDADCSQNSIAGYASGCNNSVRPGGELGAGGNNVDSCFGDSGGPLYLLADDGEEYLVGVTSRSYAGVPYNAPCRYGGIYVRPDAVLDWIEDNAGPVALPVCNHAPTVREKRVAAKGGRAELQLAFDDEDRAPDARWSIASGPKHGRATITRDGELSYTADAGYEGTDRVTVRIDDGGNPEWPRTGTPLTGEGVVTFDVTGGDPSPQVGGGQGTDDDDDVVELDTASDTGTSEYRRLGGCEHAGGGSLSAAALVALALVARRVRRA